GAQFGSPYVMLQMHMGQEDFGDFYRRCGQIAFWRTNCFPDIRRAASVYAGREFSNLVKALGFLGPALRKRHPIYRFQRAFDNLYVPIRPAVESSWKVELRAMFRSLAPENEPDLKFVSSLVARSEFPHFHRKVVEAATKAFDRYDSFFPALAYERFMPRSKADLQRFRINRDDFDELKVTYVDIFEITSRALAYIGAIANHVRRGSEETWVDGQTRSLDSVLKMTSFQREFVLQEFPGLRTLYDEIDRSTRNDFGHFKVRYDFSRGVLVNEQGVEENFLLFLVDVLGAARVSEASMRLLEYVNLFELGSPEG
ncbi:MAG TPA: hypothetical protein VGR28_05180, partial [Candidatus Thermoplasmatota archaeon]|nr:hypothetical protein [Candidatus Thermoplasmatota archaeon]